MKTALKVIGWIVLTLAVLALLLYGAIWILFSPGSNSLSEKQIIALVEKNDSLLREVSAELAELDYTGIIDDENCGEFSDTVAKALDIKGLEYIHVHENGVIEFNCGGWGFGSQTRYCGFYYSPADKPQNIMFNEPLTQHGKDCWVWKESGGDNAFQTSKILDNFYYYTESY